MSILRRWAAARRVVKESAVKEAPPKQPAAVETPPPSTDPAVWDEVDRASDGSFPASDAPPWTLGRPRPPAAGQAEQKAETKRTT